MRYSEINTEPDHGKEYRKKYYESICRMLDDKACVMAKERDAFMTPERLAENREAYRQKYVEMLGWPLTEYSAIKDAQKAPDAMKELVEELEFLKIYRLSVETMPGLWFQGLLYEPADHPDNPPLVILNPGGGYRVEDLVAHGEYDCGQYKNIGGRVLETGTVVYAPQFLLWVDEEQGVSQPGTRQIVDAKLKAMGGSAAALEIFNVRRMIDYFVAWEHIDSERIGMMGLSYGGFYTLYISAAEPRIKSVFSSCFFSDRLSNVPGACRPDWTWQGSAKTFLDAEVAALIVPRPLYLENGEKDILFPAEISEAEYQRLKPFYEAAGATDKLLFYRFEGEHEVAVGDQGLEFFLDELMK